MMMWGFDALRILATEAYDLWVTDGNERCVCKAHRLWVLWCHGCMRLWWPVHGAVWKCRVEGNRCNHDGRPGTTTGALASWERALNRGYTTNDTRILETTEM